MRAFKWTSFKQSTLLLILFFSAGIIQAQVSTKELAFGKKTSQSSNYSDTAGQSSNAVDGNTSGEWAWINGSVTHTALESDPWWEVDLREDYNIKEIYIWNRTDCCMDRLDNMRILIKKDGDESYEQYMDSDHRYNANERYPLKFTELKQGRYVRIQLINPNGILSLAEVKVYGSPANGRFPDDRSIPKEYKLTVENSSAWDIRFRVASEDVEILQWTTVKGGGNEESMTAPGNKPIVSYNIQWNDLGTWREFGGTPIIPDGGESFKIEVSGSIFSGIQIN